MRPPCLLVRSEVGQTLQPFAQHLWEVRWDRRGRPPRVSQTIPFPTVNLTVEAGASGEVRHGHGPARRARLARPGPLHERLPVDAGDDPGAVRGGRPPVDRKLSVPDGSIGA